MACKREIYPVSKCKERQGYPRLLYELQKLLQLINGCILIIKDLLERSIILGGLLTQGGASKATYLAIAYHDQAFRLPHR